MQLVDALPANELVWSDSLLSAFHAAQKVLSSARVIMLPHPDDQLWIVTDGSVKKHSIGSTLFVTCDNKVHLAGFFSAKLRSKQPTWLPCEVEAALHPLHCSIKSQLTRHASVRTANHASRHLKSYVVVNFPPAPEFPLSSPQLVAFRHLSVTVTGVDILDQSTSFFPTL